MSTQTLDDVVLTRAVAIDRMMPQISGHALAKKRCWWVIGRVGTDTPFLLSYQEGGATQWTCAAALGEGLRKKILGRVRTELRQATALPGYAVVHDLTHLGLREADAPAAQIWQQFFDQEWRANTLSDRDEDWLVLRVPFAEKDQAKAMGAKWDASKKVWLARADQRDAFAKWLS